MTPAVALHDPLCPLATVGHRTNTACWCVEIARVRADEREAASERVQDLLWEVTPFPMHMSGEFYDVRSILGAITQHEGLLRFTADEIARAYAAMDAEGERLRGEIEGTVMSTADYDGT